MEQLKSAEEKRTQCPACARPVEPFWNFCVKCGAQLKDQIQVAEYIHQPCNVSVDHSKDRS